MLSSSSRTSILKKKKKWRKKHFFPGSSALCRLRGSQPVPPTTSFRCQSASPRQNATGVSDDANLYFVGKKLVGFWIKYCTSWTGSSWILNNNFIHLKCLKQSTYVLTIYEQKAETVKLQLVVWVWDVNQLGLQPERRPMNMDHTGQSQVNQNDSGRSTQHLLKIAVC